MHGPQPDDMVQVLALRENVETILEMVSVEPHTHDSMIVMSVLPRGLVLGVSLSYFPPFLGLFVCLIFIPFLMTDLLGTQGMMRNNFFLRSLWIDMKLLLLSSACSCLT